MTCDFLIGPIRETSHRGDDDLLSGGLGVAGLRAAAVPFSNADAPSPTQLRQRALQANWKGIADLGPLGGFGELYGDVPLVPGREYQAFARLPHAHAPHRVLLQVPDAFDHDARCLVVTAASGSRGVYGAIALAAAWGLPRGCAVVHTDKGNGTGYFDVTSATGVALDGTRAPADSTELEFVPDGYMAIRGGTDIAVKHAHSGDNPEGDWGRHVLQAARFGLAMLERAFPAAAPFTAQNTRIIAVGVSNGGGAVLQAAGVDDEAILGGVVALAPNIHAPQPPTQDPQGDYTIEGALLLPCALSDARFDNVPFARVQGQLPPGWAARGAGLHAQGLLHAAEPRAQAAEALERLRAQGWSEATIVTAASTTALDLWRAIAVTYVSAYTRSRVGAMPCGYRFTAKDAVGAARAATPAERAAWWSDAGGIPPGAGVALDEPVAPDAALDPALPGLLRLYRFWNDNAIAGGMLQASVQATTAQLPRKQLPLWIVHGREDGLVPNEFTSEPYVAWLRANGREPIYWPLAHAQHFDAFLAVPGFGDRYVPLLPYGYHALDRMLAHLRYGKPLDASVTPVVSARGAGRLTAAQLALQ